MPVPTRSQSDSRTEDPTLTQTAVRNRTAYEHLSPLADRKARGQFFTEARIARFMASLLPTPSRRFRLLDAGAGTGVLTAAVCDRLSRLRSPREMQLVLYENDGAVIPYLADTLDECWRILNDAGHSLSYEIRDRDFVLDHANAIGSDDSLFADRRCAGFDAAILNPPYFKLRADGAHAGALSHVFPGQPNVYAQFMAVALELLKPDGKIVAITPRSYCNGLYFRGFRQWFLERARIDRLHLFDSRQDAFKEDDVLQESLIVQATKAASDENTVSISCGTRSDLNRPLTCRVVHSDVVLRRVSDDCLIRVPTSSVDEKIIRAVDDWPTQFGECGLCISTGPVVLFRSRVYLEETAEKAGCVPLLGPHNVKPFTVIWPIQKKKWPLTIRSSAASRKLLVPTCNYVLLKRFSAKEERRRLTAGCFLASDWPAHQLGLENHLNYVYGRDEPLSDSETYGIAAIFNSVLLDLYFRTFSGNTQVNATEIRCMGFPDRPTIQRIGERLRQAGAISERSAEEVVLDEIGVNGEVRAAVMGHFQSQT